MARPYGPIPEAAFGYGLGVRACRHLRSCVIATTLLATTGRAHASDDAPKTAESPATESSGSTAPALVDPVVGESLCPLPDAIWQELVTLVPRERLIARLRGPSKPNASIQIEDLGAMFRVSVLNKVREYREEARECAYRAKVAALFAALIIDPTALINAGLCERPPCSPPPEPAPPTPIETPVPPPAPAPPPLPMVRLELSPTFVTGLGVQDLAAHWGGVLRVAVGRSPVVPVLGAAALWPADTNVGGVRLRQWRLPVDLGIRATLASSSLDFYGELGLAFALLSERALDLASAKTQIGIELGGRISLGARLARRTGLTPFISLQAEFLPDPPRVFALPEGVAGRTPYVWMGACAGASWGI